jgi:phenylalanyl-tRNA synthetase beta chain
MPTITINRKVLEKVIGKKLPEEKLKDRISMLGTDLEDVTDDEITVEIFPNRPDMLSEQGFGRALSSFIGVKTGLQKFEVKKSNEKVYVTKGMDKIRPFTVCALIKNLKLDDEKIREIIQIQEKLHITFCRRRKKAAIGIYPLEKIKLPITFTHKKPEEIIFRPLEGKKEINANEILLQHPTGIKYKHLVKGLNEYALFHGANNEVLSFTPIINSHKTGKINDTTHEAFLEVSGFDYFTSEYVLNIMCAALSDMGADIYSMDVIYPDETKVTPNMEPREMDVDREFINKWLGLDLSQKEFVENLSKMGFGYKNGKVLVPCYRPDIIHPADIAEDIAIAYGYENFVPVMPKKATVGGENKFEVFRKKVINLLIGLNMLEISSYHLSNEKVQIKNMNLDTKNHVNLSHAVSEEFDIMRVSVLASLMQVLSENTHNEYPQNIFESGFTFVQGKADTGVKETNKLACLLCDNSTDYTKIRQVLDYIFRHLDLTYEIKEIKHGSFIEGRAGNIIVNKKSLGVLGELNPKVITNFEVEMPISGFEIDLKELFEEANKQEDDFVEQNEFLISNELLNKYSNFNIFSRKVMGVNIIENEKKLDKEKNVLIKIWENKNPDESVELQKYNEFHKSMGLDVDAAAYAIIKRYLNKGNFPNINSAVDAGNIISVKNLTSIGLFDLDKIKGKIKVRLSNKEDTYLPYGAKTSQKIKSGRIILEDEQKIFAVIGYKDSQETKVTTYSKNLFVVSWGQDKKSIEMLFDDFEKLVK